MKEPQPNPQLSPAEIQELRRRSILPRPDSTVWSGVLLGLWIGGSLMVAAIESTAPSQEHPGRVWLIAAAVCLLAILGLFAIGRGRAQPWAHRLLTLVLGLFTLGPLTAFVHTLTMPKRPEGYMIQGGAFLLAFVWGLLVFSTFTFGKPSRFFYRVRKHRRH